MKKANKKQASRLIEDDECAIVFNDDGESHQLRIVFPIGTEHPNYSPLVRKAMEMAGFDPDWDFE